MNLKLYERYKDRDKESLFDVVINKENYQEDLFQVVNQIIHERKLSHELEQRIEEIQNKQAKIIESQSKYFNELNYLKVNGFYRDVQPSFSVVFENKLEEKEIFFLKEHKIDGTEFGPFHLGRFYFYNEELEKVENAIIELGWANKPEISSKPLFSRNNILILIGCFLFFVIYLAKCTNVIYDNRHKVNFRGKTIYLD